jgi:hypothetical protein
MEVSIRRQLETVIMRSLSAFLGLCSLMLLSTTLVDSACLKHLNNEHIISDDNWEAIKPFFFAMDIGMYGQCFAIYLPIAFERGSESEEQEGELTEQEGELTEQENSNANLNVICQKDVEKGLMRIATAGGILFVVVIYFLTAVYALSPKNEDFRYVSAIQITLHIGVGISSLFLILTICRDLKQNKSKVCCCHCRNFGIVLEEIVYIVYFSGALAFNGFSFFVYIEMLKKDSNDERRTGAAEAFFGFCSVIGQFTAIKSLKRHQEGQRKQSSHDLCSTTKKYCIALGLLLVMSVALAGADFVREDFDKDEKDFKSARENLFIGYDLLYPLVVDFRLHSAIMIFCIFEENRQEKKRRYRESGQHRQSSSYSAVANSPPPQTATLSQHVSEPQLENSQHSSQDVQTRSQRQPPSSQNPQTPSKLQEDQQDSQPQPENSQHSSQDVQTRSQRQPPSSQNPQTPSKLQEDQQDSQPQPENSQHSSQDVQTRSQRQPPSSQNPQTPSKLQEDQQDSQPLPKKLGTRSAKPQAKSNSQESRLQELQSRPEDPPPPSKDSQKLAQGLRTPSEHSQTWSTEPQSPVSRTTDAFTRIEEKSTGVAETIN